MFKSTALLTTALFFAIAPSPDANVLSEITGGFLKADTGVELATTETTSTLQITYINTRSSSEVITGF